MGSTPAHPGSPLRFRIAFAVTAMMLLGIAVILPFSLRSVVDDVLGPATGNVTPITKTPLAATARDYCRLHLAVVNIDASQLLATLRVSGHCICHDACDVTRRIIIASLADDDAEAEGMPPSATITLTAGAISQSVDLPIRGHPARYPFDHYDMVLAIALQRIGPDGTVATLTRDQVADHLALSVQELLPRQTMSLPTPVDPESLRTQDDPLPYVYAFGVSFESPLYLRLLTIILVLLIAAAAAYAVFMRPLEDLVVNSGALVLGVWGVRGILTPGNLFNLTAVDLALSIVIIFLLGAITVRALMFLYERGEIRLLRRRPRR